MKSPAKKPNEHVMTIITFLALIPLVYIVPDFIKPYLPDIKWLNVVIAVGIIVPIMSYIILPLSQHLFGKLLIVLSGLYKSH